MSQSGLGLAILWPSPKEQPTRVAPGHPEWLEKLLTQRLASKHPSVLAQDGGARVPLVGVLYEGVALVNRAAHHPAVLGENGFHIGLLDHGCVEIANEDSGVNGLGVILVCDVARLHLQ